MSDMSFKQARELTERIELAELTLAQTLKKIELASTNFDATLSKQQNILHYIPIYDKRLTMMKIVVSLNIGFIMGLIVSKYLF
jgi:hypothetical protein